MTETLERPQDPPRASEDDAPRTIELRWHWGYLALLLVATGVLDLWNITINGMGNQFYAAAVQAGSQDWEALLFGSLDAQNFITVDKPPLAQWVMGLSGQIFGFSSASMLIPEALMGIASVALCYAAVARIAGRWTGLLAGTALAVMPVAVLMFRFNNPDAAMVLLMTVAAYCTVRALQSDGGGERSDGKGHGARWLALAGVAVGLAFLAKMLEGVMVLPALGAAYLLAAPVPMRRRWLNLLAGGAAFLASAGWFVVLTLLWPASSRPYLAGSKDNSFMDLVLGYNGFSRVLGHNHQFQPPADVGTFAGSEITPGKHGFGGFGSQSEGTWRLVSGEFGFEIGWLLPTALVVTVLVVIARGRRPRTDLVRAGAVIFGGWLVVDGTVLSYMHGMIHPYYSLSIAPPIAAMFAIGVRELWDRRETVWYRASLAVVLLGTGVFGWWILRRNGDFLPALRWAILGVAVLSAVALVSRRVTRTRPMVAALALALGLVAALAGPTAYAVATDGSAHTGGGPLVGPAEEGGSHGGWNAGVDNPQLNDMLKNTNTRWSAAIERSNNAASLELATGTSVMAIGGFSGTDPTPTLAQFQDDVANHRIGYYVKAASGGHRPGWNPKSHTDITDWVTANFPASKVGDNTVYDLSKH